MSAENNNRQNFLVEIVCLSGYPDGTLDVRKFVLWTKYGQILPTLRPESVFTVTRI